MRLPFEKAVIEADETLSRVVVQRTSRGHCGRSFSAYAFASAAGIRGEVDRRTHRRRGIRRRRRTRSSTPCSARLSSVGCSARTRRGTQQLRTPAGASPASLGAAFPGAAAASGTGYHPSARVAFCGDLSTAATAGGSVEGARSADSALQRPSHGIWADDMNVDNQGLGEFDARVSCNVELARAMEYDTLRCGALYFLTALPLRSTLWQWK